MDNKFDITDLMINDIVLCHGLPVQIASIVDDGTIGFTTKDGDFQEDEFENMQPIMITDQLLEDSLFKVVEEDGDVVFRFRERRDGYSVVVDLRYNFPTETYKVKVYGMNGSAVVTVPESTGEVNWLHELQHYFKRYRLDTIWDVSIKIDTED